MLHHRTAALTTALAAALVAPAPALAVRHTVYKVELEGRYWYSAALDHREQGFRRQTTIDAQGIFVSEPGELSFLDGAADDTPAGRSRADLDLLFRSSGTLVETSDGEHGVHDVRSCAVEDRPLHGQRAQGWVQQSLLQPLVVGAPVAMDARIATAFEIPLRPSARCPEGGGVMIGSAADETLGRLDADFELPREATTAGKTIQLLQGPGHEACPGSESPESVACSFRWEATVTLTRTLDEELGGSAPPLPPTGPPTSPAVSPPVAPARPSIPGKRASADAKASTVTFAASCAAGCAGTATLTVPGARSATRTVPFAIPPGAGDTVRVALPRRTRTALRRAGRGRLDVRLTPASGGPVVRRSLTVRVGRR